MKKAQISRRFAGFDLDDELRREEEGKAEKSGEAKGQKPIKKEDKQNFHIEFSGRERAYRVEGVECNRRLYTVEFQIDNWLLDGETHSCVDWQKLTHAKYEDDTGSFIVGAMPIYHALITKLYLNRNGPYSDVVNKAKDDLSNLIKDSALATTSIVSYDPDEVSHYMPPKLNEWKGDFTKDMPSQELCNPVLGTNHKSLSEIVSPYNWLTGGAFTIRKPLSRPHEISEIIFGDLGVDGLCVSMVTASAPVRAIGVRYWQVGAVF